MPSSAELKLIQALQKKVAKQTKDYDAQVPEQMRVTDEAKGEATAIAGKQARVTDLTRKFANKLSKDANAAEERK